MVHPPSTCLRFSHSRELCSTQVGTACSQHCWEARGSRCTPQAHSPLAPTALSSAAPLPIPWLSGWRRAGGQTQAGGAQLVQLMPNLGWRWAAEDPAGSTAPQGARRLHGGAKLWWAAAEWGDKGAAESLQAGGLMVSQVQQTKPRGDGHGQGLLAHQLKSYTNVTDWLGRSSISRGQAATGAESGRLLQKKAALLKVRHS